MSKLFIQSFAPSMTSLVTEYFPAMVNLIFPDSVAEECPEPTLIFSSPLEGRTLRIRNPCLCIAAAVGLFVGLALGTRLQEGLAMKTVNKLPVVSICNFQIAFVCFGLMNLVAMPLHCFVDSSSNMPLNQPYFWALDCIFTGISSTALTASTLPFYGQFFQVVNQNQEKIGFLWWFGNALICVAVTIRFFFQPEATLGLELWYGLPLGVASHALIPLVLVQIMKDWLNVGILVLLFGLTTVHFGIMLDASFCRLFGPYAMDMWMAPNAIFWGCDIAFVGIYHWISDNGGRDCRDNNWAPSMQASATNSRRKKMKRL